MSAVIPVYNGERYLGEAIRSVLEQTHPAIECVVVDDGSTDGSREVAREFGSEIRYEFQDNAGVAAARNRGADLASGEYLAFIDHDDVWLESRCERGLGVAAGRQDCLTLCGVTEVDADLNPLRAVRLSSPDDLLEGMVTFNDTTIPSCSSAALVPKALFSRLRGFDMRLGMSADWDFTARSILAGPIEYVDEPLVLYRRHDSNWSTRAGKSMEKDMVLAYDKIFSSPSLSPRIKEREREAYARLYRMLAGSYVEAGDWLDGFRALAQGVRRDPSIAAEVPRALTRRLRPRGATP